MLRSYNKHSCFVFFFSFLFFFSYLLPGTVQANSEKCNELQVASRICPGNTRLLGSTTMFRLWFFFRHKCSSNWAVYGSLSLPAYLLLPVTLPSSRRWTLDDIRTTFVDVRTLPRPPISPEELTLILRREIFIYHGKTYRKNPNKRTEKWLRASCYT